MKKTKLPSLVSILILTLITAFAWLSFSVYRALTVQPAPVVPKEVSEPLTPTLDSETIESLRTREFFEDFQIPEISPKGAPVENIEEEVIQEAVEESDEESGEIQEETETPQ